MTTKNFYRKWRQQQETSEWLRDRLLIVEAKYTLALIGCAVSTGGFVAAAIILLWSAL